MKYALYVNGVMWDYFKTLKEIDEFIFEKGFDERIDFIEVKKYETKKGGKNAKRNKRKKANDTK